MNEYDMKINIILIYIYIEIIGIFSLKNHINLRYILKMRYDIIKRPIFLKYIIDILYYL